MKKETLEEPKPIHEQIIEHCGGEEKFKEIAGLKPKQETLEEAAENYKKTTANKMAIEQIAFIAGAEWQAERMYSEEEVIAFVKWMYDYKADINKVEEWFEQFKKK
jgi:hypothetical protein